MPPIQRDYLFQKTLAVGCVLFAGAIAVNNIESQQILLDSRTSKAFATADVNANKSLTRPEFNQYAHSLSLNLGTIVDTTATFTIYDLNKDAQIDSAEFRKFYIDQVVQ